MKKQKEKEETENLDRTIFSTARPIWSEPPELSLSFPLSLDVDDQLERTSGSTYVNTQHL